MGKSVGKKAGAFPTAPPAVTGGHSFDQEGPSQTLLNGLLALLLAALAFSLVWFLNQPILQSRPAAGSRLSLLTTWLVPEGIFMAFTGRDRGAAQGFAILDRWPIVSVGTIYLLAGWGLGQLIFKPLTRVVQFRPLEKFVMGHALGLQALSLIGLAAGLLLQGSAITLVLRLLVLTFAILGMVFCIRDLYQTSRRHRAVGSATSSSPSNWQVLTIVVLSIPLLLSAMLPPSDFDVREYHLQVPKEWFQQGSISYLPHNIYGNMPLGAEMPCYTASHLGFGPSAWWWGALTGKTIMGYHSLLAALALFALAQRAGFSHAALPGAIIYLVTPWIFHVSTQGLNEGVYALYFLLAGYAWLLAEGRHRSAILLSGLFAGAAASCKYPAVVFVVLPLLLTITVQSYWPSAKATSIMERPGRLLPLVFLIGTGCSAGLWYLKNALLIGNPVFPLLESWLPLEGRSAEQMQQWATAHAPPGFTFAAVLNSVQAMLMQSELASAILPAFIGLGIGAIFFQKSLQNPSGNDAENTSNQRFIFATMAMRYSLAWMLVTVILWWFFTHRLERFLVPTIPLGIFLVMGGVELAWQRGTPFRIAIGLMLGLGVFYQMTACLFLTGDNRILVPLALLRDDAPVQEQATPRTSAAHRWLNANILSEEKVLLVGDAQVFDLEMPVLYNTCFDRSILVDLLADHSPEEFVAELQSQGIRYVWIDQNELKRYRSPGNYGYDPRLTDAYLLSLIENQVLVPINADRSSLPLPAGLWEVSTKGQSGETP